MDTVMITPQENQADRKLPGFVLGWAITDLVFCAIRFPLFLLGVVAILTMFKSAGTAVFLSIIGELVTGCLIVICGLPANIGLIRRKRWAINWAYALIGVTVLSILVALWQQGFNLSGKSGATLVGAVFGAGVAMLARITLLIFYWVAVKRAKKFFAERDAATFSTSLPSVESIAANE